MLEAVQCPDSIARWQAYCVVHVVGRGMRGLVGCHDRETIPRGRCGSLEPKSSVGDGLPLVVLAANSSLKGPKLEPRTDLVTLLCSSQVRFIFQTPSLYHF